MSIQGLSLLGSKTAKATSSTFKAANRVTGDFLEPSFHEVSAEEVETAAQLAAEAFTTFAHTPGKTRAQLLRHIASGIESLGGPLTARVMAETALPEGRVVAETGRTCNQLRMFADLVEEGSWVDARIEHADPGRTPAPKPDVRSMLRPLGPVVVFGPSNFPLAFSTAGGDTASALAAGNPVISVAHYAHPGTCELVGRVIVDAVRSLSLPEGVFSLLFSQSHDAAQQLVTQAAIRAVAFTGSRKGGETLRKLIVIRPVPVPLYAEMSSVNPVVILPEAMKARAEALATGLFGSVTLGVGQFCTNPGLILVPDQGGTPQFRAKLIGLMSGTTDTTMLTQGIRETYAGAVKQRALAAGVETLVRQDTPSGTALFQTSVKTFLNTPELAEEIFGPATLLVVYDDTSELHALVDPLEGQLTATVHGEPSELVLHRSLLNRLESKAGRVIINGFPTGVEVGSAMVHGGPYPATSDGQSTSVGTRAITRFARPVCYQDVPEALLPDELKNTNPLGILRKVDGREPA
jgi:alpha-ketoglutaric semialdehyde dehydrogenase